MFDGANLGGTPRYLALGHAQSIASGSTGYFAVATESGQILYFNANTDAQVGTINFSSSQLSMSADGTVPRQLTGSGIDVTDSREHEYRLFTGAERDLLADDRATHVGEW